MSNPTVTMPRELAERLDFGKNMAGALEALPELRALLAQPAEQPQGEPVAYVDYSASGGVRWRPGELGKCCDGMPLYTRPAEQPEVVADLTARLSAQTEMLKQLWATDGSGHGVRR